MPSFKPPTLIVMPPMTKRIIRLASKLSTSQISTEVIPNVLNDHSRRAGPISTDSTKTPIVRTVHIACNVVLLTINNHFTQRFIKHSAAEKIYVFRAPQKRVLAITPSSFSPTIYELGSRLVLPTLFNKILFTPFSVTPSQ